MFPRMYGDRRPYKWERGFPVARHAVLVNTNKIAYEQWQQR